MADYRQANYVPLVDPTRLDLIRAKYVNLKFAIPSNRTFQVTGAFEFNLPGIAWEVYRETDLWWAIALYNDIFDPLTELTAGKVLKIPDLTALSVLLSSTDQFSTQADVVL